MNEGRQQGTWQWMSSEYHIRANRREVEWRLLFLTHGSSRVFTLKWLGMLLLLVGCTEKLCDRER